MKIHLLRGRVAIRPIVETKRGNLFLPTDWQREFEHSQGIKAKSSHKGKVLGFGPPAMTQSGHELPHGFEVGDVVNFAYHVNEKASDGQLWEDGEPCIYIAQEHINGVYE